MSGSSRRMPLKKCEKKHDIENPVVIDSDSDESDVYTVDSPEDPLGNNFSAYSERNKASAEISDSSSSDCEITACDQWEKASSRSRKKDKTSAWSSECISDMPDVLDCLSMIYTNYCGDGSQDVGIAGSDTVIDREKHKETAEYRHAEEVEWESRKQLLKIQVSLHMYFKRQ
jgi:hypothetical protein